MRMRLRMSPATSPPRASASPIWVGNGSKPGVGFVEVPNEFTTPS